MCLGAIYWARLARLYYAATQHDAARAGFDDAHIYREMALAPSLRSLPTASSRASRMWAALGFAPFTMSLSR